MNMSKYYSILLTGLLFLITRPGGSQTQVLPVQSDPHKASTVTITDWGYAGNDTIHLVSLRNSKGMEIHVTDFGGTLTYVSVPDRNGIFENVVLGFDHIEQYLAGHPNFGSTIGRFANRIGGAKFSLNGVEYQLARNSGMNTLHGGTSGFDKKIFKIDASSEYPDSCSVAMSYYSPDMEEGYPGNLTLRVIFTLTNENDIKIRYEAVTDKPTVVNFTNHSYFNLNACKSDALNHQLKIYADSITPTDPGKIPTGKIAPVAGTPYDFTFMHQVGDSIGKIRGGYDINYVLNKRGMGLELAAEIYEPISGRIMQTLTTEPGLQLYTSNYLYGYKGSHGITYQPHYAICLEAQHFPDSPNKPQFPSVVLKPGQIYHQLTIYRFMVKGE
jgi:aldose 1-epimerase